MSVLCTFGGIIGLNADGYQSTALKCGGVKTLSAKTYFEPALLNELGLGTNSEVTTIEKRSSTSPSLLQLLSFLFNE
jgi:hypothetical protein